MLHGSKDWNSYFLFGIATIWFLQGSYTMEVRSYNDENNDPPNSRAIPYDALNVGLGGIGKVKIVFGRSTHGCIISWDIRGGTQSSPMVYSVANSNQGVHLVDFSTRKARFIVLILDNFIIFSTELSLQVYCASYHKKRIRLYDIKNALS
ncbi:hypothetical protein KSP39_PZI000084 [Platanthera zijinensis]|uniref:Uncharacterized protein n=1 Tax=Platanthera zijinensis TaxID=2320716 RepID=A0AAP0C398_9ASPA